MRLPHPAAPVPFRAPCCGHKSSRGAFNERRIKAQIKADSLVSAGRGLVGGEGEGEGGSVSYTQRTEELIN